MRAMRKRRREGRLVIMRIGNEPEWRLAARLLAGQMAGQMAGQTKRCLASGMMAFPG